MAKTQALRVSSRVTASALQRSAEAITEAIVDDAGTAFDLTAEAEQIEASWRGTLARALGTGMCHLYMVSLGYVWHDHAANVIPTTKPLADFVYDGGPAAGHGVVLAEAKGSMAPGVDAPSLGKTADAAYLKQVDRHIGMLTPSGPVVHGYVTAFGAQLNSVRTVTPPPNAFLHVAETSGIPVGGPPPSTFDTVDTAIALANYRAAFMLAGAPLVVQAIDALTRGETPPDEDEEFVRVVGRDGATFLRGRHDFYPFYRDARHHFYRVFQDTYREWAAYWIQETIARHFLQQLSSMTTEEWRPRRLELPVARRDEPLDGIFGEEYVFPDGFAVVSFGSLEGAVRWSPIRGVRQ